MPAMNVVGALLLNGSPDGSPEGLPDESVTNSRTPSERDTNLYTRKDCLNKFLSLT